MAFRPALAGEVFPGGLWTSSGRARPSIVPLIKKRSPKLRFEFVAANKQPSLGGLPGIEALVQSLRSEAGKPLRRRLHQTRTAVTHKFDIAGHEGYLTVGLFEDHQPGELFVTMAKEGSTIGGLMDAIGTLTSMALQYGVPLEALVRKFAHQRFEPSGFTKNPEIRNASSITDYVFRWMAMQFVPGYREANAPARNQPELPISEDTDVYEVEDAGGKSKDFHASATKTVKSLSDSVAHFQQDAPTCPNCGHVAVRNGACYKCLNCGESLGCS